jgi:protein-S-isoprenylcysteine O-methyltransferase Ste14
MDWHSFRYRHSRVFACLVILKRLRTKFGVAAALYCLVEGLYFDEVPFDLDKLNIWVVVGLLLILVGLAIRLAAYGSIKKKESLATSGVYSLCRHPLYLGSILLTYGFCFLLDDAANFMVATLYFAVFYTITIIWEEVRLAARYGEAHREYCRMTPLLLPLGRFRAGRFEWRRALSAGGLTLIAMTAILLSGVEAMAELMHHH